MFSALPLRSLDIQLSPDIASALSHCRTLTYLSLGLYFGLEEGHTPTPQATLDAVTNTLCTQQALSALPSLTSLELWFNLSRLGQNLSLGKLRALKHLRVPLRYEFGDEATLHVPGLDAPGLLSIEINKCQLSELIPLLRTCPPAQT